jgi:hypothetical protein
MQKVYNKCYKIKNKLVNNKKINSKKLGYKLAKKMHGRVKGALFMVSNAKNNSI